jgi:hypothetical protein
MRNSAAPTIHGDRRHAAVPTGRMALRFGRGSPALLISVKNGPGIRVLTRTVGPNACASPSVIALIPALAAA